MVLASVRFVGMTTLLLPALAGDVSSSQRLQVAVTAYLSRYRGASREHTMSDLRVFLRWCAQRGLDPLAAQRVRLELYVRWCQEVRQFKPSTVSRRTSVVCGFFRTCVIDGVLEHSPAACSCNRVWCARGRDLPDRPLIAGGSPRPSVTRCAERQSGRVRCAHLGAAHGRVG
jgi:hypothetical protein